MGMGKLHRIAIVADGDFPTASLPLKLLSEADIVIACDGAADSLVAAGFMADYIVGDMDTLSEPKQHEFQEKIIRIAEQESNDLTKAFRFALNLCSLHTPEEGLKKVSSGKNVSEYIGEADADRLDIIVLGATGKREDHTIGNISLLADYQMQAEEFSNAKEARIKITIKAYTDYGVFIPYYSAENKPILLKDIMADIKGRPLSLFGFDNTLRITSQGLEYQTSGVIFDRWWKATLNCIAEEGAKLTLSHSSPVLLYFPY